MSIQSQINRINNNIAAAYNEVEAKGGALPEIKNSANLADATRSIPQNTLTAGDGITIQENAISVTTPVKNITQAEYDALSEEAQNTGLYIVTDANINFDSPESLYSTEETRIGTWIDGKPLYRKTIKQVATISGGTIEESIPEFLQSARLVNIEGCFYVKSNDVTRYPLNYMHTDGYYSWYGTAYQNNNDLVLYIEWPEDGSMEAILICEYTKTTD